MSIKNFIPEVWAEDIEKALAQKCVFAEDCNRKYEGKVTQQGESVKILGVGKPTIHTIDRAEAAKEIEAAEQLEDVSTIMHINQLSYFNYEVGNVDEAQAKGGIMEALADETTESLAAAMDAHIASRALEKGLKKLFETPKKLVAGTAGSNEANVLELIDDAATILYENDVPSSAKIVINVSPRFYKLFKREYGVKDTDNSEILKTGRVTQYGSVWVKMSTGVATTNSGAVDHIMIRTQRAIAFANPYTFTKAYDPERSFKEAVKGFSLYQAKVVRPKELVVIPVTY